MSKRVAIIGAGVSGMACAAGLKQAGVDCVVIDKGRAPGGRASTRRRGGHQFDHGAPHFNARDPDFVELVAGWLREGIVGRSETGYVGVPGMDAIVGRLAEGIDVRCGVHCLPPRRDGGLWAVMSQEGDDLGRFDVVVTTAPPEQSAELAAGCPELAGRIGRVKSSPRWVAMAAFTKPVADPLGSIESTQGPFALAVREGDKPGRDAEPDRWVIHATAEWSAAHLEAERGDIAARLLEAFEESLGLGGKRAAFVTAHRWRYALPVSPLGVDWLFDAEAGFAACGDWCRGGDIEGAYLSGAGLAAALAQPANAA